jgi:lipoyl(octanoyl) transferase
MIDASHINETDIYHFITQNCHLQLNSFWLGKINYHSAWKLQKLIHSSVSLYKLNNVILLLEHNPVYTFGKNANKNHLLPSYPKEADVIQIDRGGDITYHGPGQLVGYPIINLSYFKKSITWFMRAIEESIIDVLNGFDIKGERIRGLPGVWVNDEKICAMGVRLAKWTSMHGFALNINTDLNYFDGIIPCGIFDYGVTSIKETLEKEYKIKDIAKHVEYHLQCVLLKENIHEISRIYKKETA